MSTAIKLIEKEIFQLYDKYMLTKLIAYIIICSCIIDFSCTKKTSHGFINTKHPEQKVIIELYTGHRDGHAVIATKKIIAEQNKHSNKIIP